MTEKINLHKDIIQYVTSELKKSNVKGAAFALMDDKGKLFSQLYGNVRHEDTPFIIGSMSKSFTALGIMILAQRGLLLLDAPIAEYLPSLKTKYHIEKNITVAMLLHHISGIPHRVTPKNLYGAKRIPNKFMYANENYNLLGEIIESISSKSFAQFMQDEIFSPLSMHQSTANLEKAKQNPQLQGYIKAFGLNCKAKTPYIDNTSWIQPASGYIVSTIDDMCHYLAMHLSDTPKLLSPKTMHALHYDGAEFKDSTIANMFPGSKTTYTMGWIQTECHGEPVLYHTGSVTNFMSVMGILPKQKIGFTLLLNTGDFTLSTREQIAGGVIALLLEQKPKQSKKYEYSAKRIGLLLIYTAILAIALFLSCSNWQSPLSFLLAHGLFPLFLLSLPKAIKMPWKVIRDFVPDIYIALVLSIAIPIISGIIKFF